MKALCELLSFASISVFSGTAWSAATVTPSALPNTPTLSSNSSFVVDSLAGGTHKTATISYSNLLANSQVRQGTNFVNQGDLINTNGSLNLNAVSENGDWNALRFLDKTNGQERADIVLFRSIYHDDELVFNSMHDFAFVGDLAGSGHSRFQFGGSGAFHELMLFQYDLIPTAVTPLGYSKFVAFQIPFWRATSSDSHAMGWRGEALDQAGNTELAFYAHIRGFNHNNDTDNWKVGGIGTNNVHFIQGIFTNVLSVGGAPPSKADYANYEDSIPTLDIKNGWAGNTPAVVVGADFAARTRTAGTNKIGLISFASKDNGNPTIGLYKTDNGGAAVPGTCLMIGGGTSTGEGIQGGELYASAHQGDSGTATPVAFWDSAPRFVVQGHAEVTKGFLVKSNTAASIPILSPGDNYYWSSNGVAYVICSSPSGVLTTNKIAP